MKWLAVAALAGAALSCRAQQDGGGRDVSILLFSAQPPQSVTVAAAGPGAWWAPCSACRRQPLTATLRMPAVQEIVAGGPLTVRNEEDAQVRSAIGRWHLRARSRGPVEVVLTLPSERYVAAVLMGETSSGEPRESLLAMAVAARTFVLRPSILPSRASEGAPGHLPSETCDSTACQAMRLGPVSDAVSEAVRATAGETLWFGPERAHVFFSGSCGGTTESAGALWPKLAGVPYLRSIADPYCVRKDHASWHAEIPLASLQGMALREGWRMPPRIVLARVAERTASERARTIVFFGSKGEQVAVSAPAFRLAVGRALGWNLVRSDAYDLKVRDGALVFDGHGHGHGVGLCQQGAAEMARAAKSYREILAFYFPGTTLRVTRLDEGWKQTSRGGIPFARTVQVAPALEAEVLETWRQAKSRFPPPQQTVPSVTFAPTTEIFRQLTSQPGWQVASTSGSAVVLQPVAVIASNHVSLDATLLHEMLHVCVEASASAKSPLWLREGLVEVLAGEASPSLAAPALSVNDTDRLLHNAGSRQESQAAHRAAGARARRLVERYGMSAVRGWLIAGSPVPTD